MNKIQLIRYKVLDRCLRNPVGCFGIEDLIEQCNKALSYERATDIMISERTIREDLRDIQEVYGAVFNRKLRDGHKKLYRYDDTDFSIMPQLVPAMTNEQQMLTNIQNELSEYADIPQYQWLLTFIQQRLNGADTDGQSIIGFQNNPDLIGMEHFSVLLGAILSNQTLEIIYKTYSGAEIKYQSYPYYLKQYNDRWFLVAKVEGHSRLTILPIDRIISTEVLHVDFVTSDIDMDTYFDDIVGITKDERKPVEEILIKISNERYPYIGQSRFTFPRRRYTACEMKQATSSVCMSE